MKNTVIWCVEDEEAIRQIESYALKSSGFTVREFSDGQQVWFALQQEQPDLMILDLMLPNLNGDEILHRMRSTLILKKVPVILATAKGTEYDRVHLLDAGADDYLVKPFSILELVSRVKAVLRRSGRGVDQSQSILQIGDLNLNPETHRVLLGNQKIELTYKEFELLKLFMSRPGFVFTRDQLFSQVWDDTYSAENRTLDMHIRTLRQKLGDRGAWIKTVRQVGYQLEPDFQEEDQ